MTFHHLTIAKATFAASLLRPDVTKVNRDEVPHFHHLLETAMLQCTPSNIQTCKQWLLNHVIPSKQRTAGFAKYLSSLSRYTAPSVDDQSASSASRQRLHLVYLLNDILHHVKHHETNLASIDDVTSVFAPMLPELFREAASEQKRSVCKRLDDVVNIWQQESYIPRELLGQLRGSISDPTITTTSASKHVPRSPGASTDLPFLMPSTHGDPSLPFHELPAGNFMPHIVPNRSTSMRPESIRPLQFTPGPADEGLVNVVKDFLKNVAQIDDAFPMKDEDLVPDIDNLGQFSHHNDDGEKIGDSYYGWSRAFCAKMRRRQNPDTNGSMSGNSSRSYSSSQSPTQPRKRRYSRSSSDRSRSRSRSRYGRRFLKEQSGSRSPPAARVPMQSIDPQSAGPDGPRGQYEQRASPVNAGMGHIMNNRASHLPLGSILPGHMPVPPPRPSNWPARSPWPPPPPPSAPHMGGNGFPRPPFPPPLRFQGYQQGSAFSAKPGQPPHHRH